MTVAATPVVDRVFETSTTAGAGGPLTLLGAQGGYRTANAALGTGGRAYFCRDDSGVDADGLPTAAANWEIFIGTSLGASSLSYDSCLKSSNSNAAVAWGAGTRNVFSVAPADILALILDPGFRPHAESTPAMTVRLDAGKIPTNAGFTAVAAQSTGAITAPVSNPRIDRVVIDRATGAVSVITGTPAGSPAAPAITAGKAPICQVLVQTSSTTITDSMITDERVSGVASYLPPAGAGISIGSTISVSVPLGQCRLTKSGANLLLSPFQGNLLTVNGVDCTVPDAGVTLAPTALSVGTSYNIYAVATAGAITSLEASATAHATSTTAGNKGVEIKSGDDTRSFVGIARIITGPAWADTGAQRFVISWFNRRDIPVTGATITGNTSSGSLVEIDNTKRAEFLCWADEAVGYGLLGSVSSSTTLTSDTQVEIDEAIQNSDQPATNTAAGGGYHFNVSCWASAFLSEGYHRVNLFGDTNAGTITYAAAARATVRG